DFRQEDDVDRNVGRASQPLCDLAQTPERSQRVGSARRDDQTNHDTARATAPFHHLGSRQRDGRTRAVHDRHRRADLLLRSEESLAAWQQRNTNGLLRQYLPKSTDLSQCTLRELDAIARSLNTRPRQTLGWMTPSQAFANAVAMTA